MTHLYWREVRNEDTQEFAVAGASEDRAEIFFGVRPRDSFRADYLGGHSTHLAGYVKNYEHAAEHLREQERLKELTESDASLSFRSFRKGKTVWSLHVKNDIVAEDDRLCYFASRDEALRYYFQQIAAKLADGFVEFEPRATLYSQPPAGLVVEGAKKSKKAAKAKTPAAVVTEEPAVVPEVTDRIDLPPIEWYRAAWRKLPPLPRPVPPPFNLEALLAKIRGIQVGHANGYNLPYPQGPVSKEEAHFWFEATVQSQEHFNPHELAKVLAGQTFGRYTPDQLRTRLKDGRGSRHFMLVWLLSPDEFVAHAALCDDGSLLAAQFLEHVIPYLEPAERERLAKLATPLAYAALDAPKCSPYYAPEIVSLAAVLGADEVVEFVIAKERCTHSVVELAPGVASAARLEQIHDARKPGDIRWFYRSTIAYSWLAHTETRRLDALRAGILNAQDKDEALALTQVLALVKSPAAAAHLLEVRLHNRGVQPATQWLDQQLGNAVAGLIDVAAGKGALAGAALDYLKQKARSGYQPLILELLAKSAAPGVERVRQAIEACKPSGPVLNDETTPVWLRDAVKATAALKPVKGSPIDAASLPPLNIAEGPLSPAQVEAVLVALQHSEFDAAQPLTAQLRLHVDAVSRADFVWQLFEQWLSQDAPAKHRWAMKALGHLGTDETALRLAALVRKWPGESQHQRAVLGLECLRAIGTSAALMQLSGIAQKLKFKALQTKAGECVTAIASDLGLSRAELEDRVVPDCGLDDRGRRSFDFGPRQFQFALGPELKPMLRDAAGKMVADLPKPNSKDDAALAGAAQAAWKSLKTQLREVAKLQAIRLEQAMVLRRRWPVADFLAFLVRHPLMMHLARTVLWAGYDEDGSRTLLFRTTDEHYLADAKDNRIELNAARVGLVHRLELTPAEAARWGEVFADYELVPPFPQLGRPTFAATDDERAGRQLSRFLNLTLPPTTLVGTLERFGWQRGPGLDNGMFLEHFKSFPDATAVITYEPGPSMQYIAESEDQTLTGCYFMPAGFQPEGFRYNRAPLAIEVIDPIVVSETILDLTQLAAKAK